MTLVALLFAVFHGLAHGTEGGGTGLTRGPRDRNGPSASDGCRCGRWLLAAKLPVLARTTEATVAALGVWILVA